MNINEVICSRSDSLLVVIDAQTRLLAAMPESTRQAMLGACATLLQAAALLDIPTLLTEHYPAGIGGTQPELLALQPDVSEVIAKDQFSARGVAQFDRLLAACGRRQLVICGAEAHVCVLQTAMQLRTEDFAVFIAADAVASRRQTNCDNALERMRAADIAIANVESVLFEWLGDRSHPRFGDVLALIKQHG